MNRSGVMLNYIVTPRLAEIDYYLERISIKLANLFGIFYDVVLFLFIALVFCSLVLWLMIPIIEFKKKNLLKKIHGQLDETKDILYSIERHWADVTSDNEVEE